MTAARGRAGWLVWPPATLGILGHMSLGMLAVIEYIRLDWLPSQPYELTAVAAVAISAALAVAGALRQTMSAARGDRALRRLLASGRLTPPTPVRSAAAALGIAEHIDMVGLPEAFAITYGLLRPRILISSGLVDLLNAAELTAVLAHERHHLLRRDPLRLLGARVLSGYGWFLPWLAWRTRRSALLREVAADRAATAQVGVAAVAGALLKLADRPSPVAVAAANPAGDLPERIADLEGRSPARKRLRGWLLGGATLVNLLGLAAASACCAGLGVAMTGGMA